MGDDAVGREPNRKYGETHNGIQVHAAEKNQLPEGISPYVVADDPRSGRPPILADEAKKTKRCSWRWKPLDP